MRRVVRFEDSAHYKLVSFGLAVWWAVFVARSMDYSVAMASQANQATEQGSLENQLLIFVLVGAGLCHFPRAWRVLQSPQGRNLITFLAIYGGWAGASLLWSEAPALTVRRFSAFLMIMTGCIGMGAGFYSRTADGIGTFVRHVVCAGVIAALVLLPSQFQKLGSVNILDPKFTLKEAGNMLVLIHASGFALLAAVAASHWRTVWRWSLLAFFMSALLLIKARSMTGDIIAAATLLASRLSPAGGVRVSLTVLGVLQTAFFADLGTGGKMFISFVLSTSDAVGDALPWLTLGDGIRNLTSLSGRLPLWTALYDYVRDRPMAGHGFGAFWTPDHLDQIYTLAKWHAVAAHNGFLDEILATGVTGCVLLTAFWVYGMAVGLRIAREFDVRIGSLLFSWVLLLLLFNTLDSVYTNFFTVPVLIVTTGLFASLKLCAAADLFDDGETETVHMSDWEEVEV